jgi:anti-sigma B factor antagonist
MTFIALGETLVGLWLFSVLVTALGMVWSVVKPGRDRHRPAQLARRSRRRRRERRERWAGFHARVSEREIVLCVRGEIDLATSPALAHAIDEVLGCGVPEVVVDLHAVTFCDASGMHALLDGAQEARARGCTLSIAGAAPELVRAFRVAGIAERLPLVGVPLAAGHG